MACSAVSPAAVLITEVLPGVNTTVTNGDTVELYNTGPGAVNLTDYILSDLDPASAETSILNEATFAPGSLSLPLLAEGEFAVVKFVDSTGGTLFSYIDTNYGLEIHAPLATNSSSYLGNDFEQLALADSSGDVLDFLAWCDSGDTLSASAEEDAREDLGAFTTPTSDYSITLNTANSWSGADTFVNLADYISATIDFNGLTSISTYGGGAIRRKSTNTTFEEAFPDGPAQWEAVVREDATLGNFSGTVTTGSGIQPIRATGDISEYIANLRISFFPERRITIDQDQTPSDFQVPDSTRQSDFVDVVVKCLAGQWEEANDDASALGYQLVEFLDTTTDNTFYILREIEYPGEVGYTGGGTYIFDPSMDAKDLVIQVPHPLHDSNTLAESGEFLTQARQRVTMIAGTHRNNSITETGCDGTFSNGDKYRISDVAHYTDTLFHATHKHLMAALPTARFVQLHGFCCSVDYGISEDVVVSEGHNSVPPMNSFARLWQEHIDAEVFVADDGMGGDLTEAALYGDGASVLGATNNIQGRLINGVTEGDECDTAALGSTGRFIHIEQDPDVREEPQHIINAFLLALMDADGGSAVDDWLTLED